MGGLAKFWADPCMQSFTVLLLQDMIPAEVSQQVELGQLDCEGAEVVESVEETIPDTKEKEKE